MKVNILSVFSVPLRPFSRVNDRLPLVAALLGLPLLQKVTTQAFSLEQLPTVMRASLGVSGLPTSHYSKNEKLVILWTDEMHAVIQPRVNEINKLAQKRSSASSRQVG